MFERFVLHAVALRRIGPQTQSWEGGVNAWVDGKPGVGAGILR